MNWLWSWTTTNTLPYPAYQDLHQIWRHVYIIRSCDSHVITTIRWSLQACAMNGSTNLSFTGSVEKFACVRQLPITNDQWYHLFHSRHPILSGWFPCHHPSTWVWGERSTIVITSPHNRDCSSTLTLHVTDLRSFVIFHNRVSLCVWKLACQKVRMWLCHYLHSSSSPPSLLLHTCLRAFWWLKIMQYSSIVACQIVICIVAFMHLQYIKKLSIFMD